MIYKALLRFWLTVLKNDNLFIFYHFPIFTLPIFMIVQKDTKTLDIKYN